MKSVKMYYVDAFTNENFQGNQAPVIINADALTEDEMQKIATELNASETVFVSSSKAADFRTRYFTPKTEVNVCGHGTVAAYYVLSKLGMIGKSKITHETNIGVLPINIERNALEEPTQIMMHQQNPKFIEVSVSREEIAEALNVDVSALMEEYPIQNVSTGRMKLIIPIVNRKTLVAMKPDFNKIYNICKKLDTNGFHLFSFDTLDLESITVARHFAPTVGVNEDPVTGIAAGALGCYLVKYCRDRIECSENMKFIMEQGDHMNKKGRIHVHIKMTDSTISSVKVGGSARVLFETTFNI
ncbi:PhzF family phenazine biosynthesis protein [Cellulosilyticum ruminicola]|uniref:PhzF family phenazine biosynthesis protein n=1 Tax=Cellulosilyticum ruminicola TaxID=425254 RepID=UPI0006D00B0D|nr:PhzF family phenazine biosynthesis isomerase [Cellulosilyticum ruminicola]